MTVAALCFLASYAQKQTHYLNLHLKDGTVKVFDLSDVDSLTFASTQSGEDDNLLSDQFVFVVSDVTWGDAKVTITPKDNEKKFYYYAMTAAKVATIENGIDGLQQYDYAWWEAMSQYYNSLNEAIQASLVSGPQTFRTSELTGGMGDAGSDVIVYCYGIDSEGQPTTTVHRTTFTTSLPNPSANTFDISIGRVLPTGVQLTVTPSNSDTYFLAVQRERYVNYYSDDTDAMATNLAKTYYNQTDAFHSGVYTSALDDFTLYSGQTYYAIVFGYDNGVSTPVTLKKFNTPRSSSTATYRFTSYFYNEEGTAIDTSVLTATGDGVYTCVVESGDEPCEMFTYITNIEVEATDSYSYAYDGGDGAAKLALVGTSKADADGVYATLDVELTDIPEIRKIVFIAPNN